MNDRELLQIQYELSKVELGREAMMKLSFHKEFEKYIPEIDKLTFRIDVLLADIKRNVKLEVDK
jgi:hypothetical protein